MKRENISPPVPSWTLETRQQLWTLYLQGKGLKKIGIELGRSLNEVRCEKWKIMVTYHPTGSRSKVVGFDRRSKSWDKRDAYVLCIAHHAHVPIKRIASLLGRSESQVLSQLKPRHKMRTFF